MNPYESYMLRVKEAAIEAKELGRFVAKHVGRHAMDGVDIGSAASALHKLSGGGKDGFRDVAKALHPDVVQHQNWYNDLHPQRKENLVQIYKAHNESFKPPTGSPQPGSGPQAAQQPSQGPSPRPKQKASPNPSPQPRQQGSSPDLFQRIFGSSKRPSYSELKKNLDARA